MDTKQFKRLLKSIKFPGGSDAFVNERTGYAKWYKRHGHAGAKVIGRVIAAARAAGFTHVSAQVSTDATGDRANHGTVLVSDGVSLTFNTFYGQTAYENHFTITVHTEATE